jgi:hypothetical protein
MKVTQARSKTHENLWLLSVETEVEDRVVMYESLDEVNQEVRHIKAALHFALLDAAKERCFILEGDTITEEQRGLLRMSSVLRMSSFARKKNGTDLQP